MGYIFRIIKKLFFWGYERNTWQYDVLCALILAFIFLTPQHWFDSGTGMKNRPAGEPAAGQAHQNSVASEIILVGVDNFPAQMAQSEIEQRVRNITGRTEIEILGIRQRLDQSGKVVAYEVDIR